MFKRMAATSHMKLKIDQNVNKFLKIFYLVP